jgi:hypothetical protein
VRTFAHTLHISHIFCTVTFHLFDWLNDLFHRINEDFNGEIFKPHLSETIKIDSDVLARIIERLYPPQSPYRFDVIGVELLGSIYERYLGKTIRPTAKTVRVEEKPEVRKAGGVYYTPKYLVDYIVKNTVGKVIEGKSPKQSLLPELKYNIICGNSLIGPDIYNQGTLFADEERDRINAFDWYADHGVRELAPAFEGGGEPPHSKPAVTDRRYSTQREIAATDAAIGRSLLNAHLFSPKGIRRSKKHPASGSNLKCAFTWQRMAEFIHGFHICHPVDGMLSFVQRSPVAPGQHLHRVESLPLRYVHLSSSHVLIVRRSPAAGADRNAFRSLSVRMGYRGRALAWGPNHSQPRGTRSGAQPASAPPQL